MPNVMVNYAGNSRAIHILGSVAQDSLILGEDPVSENLGSQSGSVTSSGLLWSETLRRMLNDPRPLTVAPFPAYRDVQKRLRQIRKNQRAIGLLRSWLANSEPAEAEEQRETVEYLKKALDQDRLSLRRLFP